MCMTGGMMIDWSRPSDRSSLNRALDTGAPVIAGLARVPKRQCLQHCLPLGLGLAHWVVALVQPSVCILKCTGTARPPADDS